MYSLLSQKAPFPGPVGQLSLPLRPIAVLVIRVTKKRSQIALNK